MEEDNKVKTMPEDTPTDLAVQTKSARDQQTKTSNSLVLLLSSLLIISCLIAGLFAFQTQKLASELTKLKTVPTPTPSAKPQATLDPTTNWKTYLDTNFSFKYPDDYSQTSLGVISPLNESRNKKDSTAQDGELKIEVYVENFTDEFTVQSCWDDHNTSGSGNITGRSSVLIGENTHDTLLWQGLGTGEFTCIKNGDKRYLINKYPSTTSRQDEYLQILSTFKFLDNDLIACTEEAKLCPDGSSVSRSGPDCEFKQCPTSPLP